MLYQWVIGAYSKTVEQFYEKKMKALEERMEEDAMFQRDEVIAQYESKLDDLAREKRNEEMTKDLSSNHK